MDNTHSLRTIAELFACNFSLILFFTRAGKSLTWLHHRNSFLSFCYVKTKPIYLLELPQNPPYKLMLRGQCVPARARSWRLLSAAMPSRCSELFPTWNILVLVFLEVPVQVGLLPEAPVAQVALEWLLLVVDVPHVPLQVGGNAE